MRTILNIVLLIVCCCSTWIICHIYYQKEIASIENANIIIISKQNMQLSLLSYKGDTLFNAPIAAGKTYGNKQKQGDMRTPEGVFKVVDIQNSAQWSHDFGDGKGRISGAYGPHFIRLDVPGHKGIGIHGTHDPQSIGQRETEGCIRLRNEDLKELVSLIYPPLTVIITPSALDENSNAQNESVK